MSLTQATRAGDFIDSIGVVIHLEYTDSPLWANVNGIINALRYMGIDHVRDGFHSSSLSATSPVLTPFHTMMTAGINFDLSILTQSYNPAIFTAIDALAAAHPGRITAIDGFNEINNWPITYGNLTGNAAAEAGQQSIFSIVNSDKNLPNVPVWDLTGAADVQSPSQTLLSTLNGRADAQNIHVYPRVDANLYDWISGTKNWYYNFDAPQKVITELGFYTTSDASYNLTPTDPGYSLGVTPVVQGEVILNCLMDAWAQGFSNTYLYELFDDYKSTSAENFFGLFNNDGSPKPVATYIHNLTSVLNDTATNATSFAAGGLSFTVNGLPSTGHQLLLEKADGNFYLTLWNEPQTRDVNVNVTVSLGTSAGTINVYDPTVSASSIKTLSNTSSVPVSLSDHPVILEIRNSGSPPPPTTTPAPTPTPVPTPTPPDPGTVTSHTLTLLLSEDRYRGDAQFIVKVDGQGVGTRGTVTASHAAGDEQAFTFTGSWGAGPHDVEISFLNDKYGGTPGRDRNLYVENVRYDNASYLSSERALYSNGSVHIQVGDRLA